MSKKITIFVIVSLIFTFLMYANGGDSVIYRKLEFTVPVGKVDPQTLPDDLIKYLSSYYSIEIMSKENRIIKYNCKKFLYYENKLLINKEKAYVKLHMNMQQQQPNLFYRKKNNDWDIDFIFTCVYHDDDIEEDIIFFHDELDRIIDAFIKKYDLQ